MSADEERSSLFAAGSWMNGSLESWRKAAMPFTDIFGTGPEKRPAERIEVVHAFIPDVVFSISCLVECRVLPNLALSLQPRILLAGDRWSSPSTRIGRSSRGQLDQIWKDRVDVIRTNSNLKRPFLGKR